MCISYPICDQILIEIPAEVQILSYGRRKSRFFVDLSDIHRTVCFDTYFEDASGYDRKTAEAKFRPINSE